MEKLYIDGQWKKGEGFVRKLINPATEQEIIEVIEASEKQTEQAILAARKAFDQSDWSKNKSRRIDGLRRLADLVEANADEIAHIETINTGKPIRESRLDISDTAVCLRYYADLIDSESNWEKQMEDGTTSKVIQEPIGVCALIVPWNFPLLLGIWKIAPALAAGNTVVFKPSEITPLSVIMLTELIDKCDFPPGVFNLVLGDGSLVGQKLVSHIEIDKVSFTGGSKTGRLINTECAKSLKRVSLELGGKSPMIVLEDADIDSAVDWILFGGFYNQGEVCVASSRILVHESIYQDLISKITEKVKRISVGNPLHEATEMGPIISKEHLDKINNYVTLGLEEGATLIGGEKTGEEGYYLKPAIFIDVHQNMRIVQEEIFGPVITLQKFETNEEAIKLANGTIYGLAAGVIGDNIVSAKEIASELKAGTVWINNYHIPYVEAPWGGFKQSGVGRGLGPQGLAAFTETKHINVNNELKSPEWYEG